MMKAVVLILAAHCVRAVNVRARDDTEIARAADQEVQGLQDLSNKGLWQKAWSQTVAEHSGDTWISFANSKDLLYPKAQILFQNLIKARHRLKAKMDQQKEDQQKEDEPQQDAQNAQQQEQQQEQHFAADAKANFLQKMTAGIKDIRDDDLAPTTTAKTTTENPQVVKEREQMAEIKAKEMAKMTAGVAEAKDVAPKITTTTEDPAARAEKEHLEQIKEAEIAKLTAQTDAKSVAKAEATVTTTTTTTTTMSTTMNAAGKKFIASLTQGKIYQHALNFAGLQRAQVEEDDDEPKQDSGNDSGSYSETMTDLDEYGF
jgi:hypothetical protein